MLKISEKKWNKMNSVDDLLDKKYGKEGTPSRESFEARAKAYYDQKLR